MNVTGYSRVVKPSVGHSRCPNDKPSAFDMQVLRSYKLEYKQLNMVYCIVIP